MRVGESMQGPCRPRSAASVSLWVFSECFACKLNLGRAVAQCKGRSILPDRSAAVTTDWQKVRLQEIVTDESREDGRMPRTIECELTDDLVDKCIPGDEVLLACAFLFVTRCIHALC